MIILGLTGSIGMGKSNAAANLRRLGVPVFDADAEVHRLLAPGGAAVRKVNEAFPGVTNAVGGIDRQQLGQRVFGNPPALHRLESILHPVVREAEQRFLAQARGRRTRLAVLDIPLLYETGGTERCDFVLVVSAPLWLQRQRVMRRRGMSEGRFAGILGAQLPDREKRRRADFVVSTGLGRDVTFRKLQAVVRRLRSETPLRRQGKTRCGKW